MTEADQQLLGCVQAIRDEAQAKLVDVQDAVTLENGGTPPSTADFEPVYRQIHSLAVVVEHLLETRG
jgi:hypothetical protein